MKAFYFAIAFLMIEIVYAQPNCEVYKFNGDSLKYKACKIAMEIKGHYQFSKEYQSILDEALKTDPTFDYAYWAKSIAYLKSGDFIRWKELIDKAVGLNPKEYLGYRGWCRYQFFRDYEGAINDIENLESLINSDIGYSQNGTYHLNIAKGLCYKAIGEKNKAIKIIEEQIERNKKDSFIGVYDYLHLGVLYLETENFEKAVETFHQQSQINELAENQYYLALTYKKLDKLNEYKSCLGNAKQLYDKGQKMSDPYSNPMDKIYAENIENEIKRRIH